MKKEIKEEWMKRLRSGEIPQTTQRLGRTDGSRCCLGVLCDIAVEEGIIPKPKEKVLQGALDVLYYGEDSCDLPTEVAQWANIQTLGEIESYPPMDDDPTLFDSLAEANDVGKSFNYIAELIDKATLLPNPEIEYQRTQG